LLLAYSGLRASELLALSRQSPRTDTLTVVGKGHKTRQVPVPPAARQHLSQLPLSLSYWQLRDGFDEARKKAGLPKGVTLHTLRHTCASWLINAGVDLYTVGRILGHSSPLTTARYAHLADASLKKAMRKLK
jgi:integrase